MSSEPATVTPPAERLPALDFARGACVLAMLLATLPWLCRPFQLFAVHPQPGGPYDRHILAGLLFLVDHKVLPLFAVIFGMGLALQIQRLGDKAKSHFGSYLVRMMVLLFIGIAHTLLLWWGDLLAVYAFVGIHAYIIIICPKVIEQIAFYGSFAIFYGFLLVGVVLAGFFLKPDGAFDLGVPLKRVDDKGPPISLFNGPGDWAERLFDYVDANNQVRIYRSPSLYPAFEHRLLLHFKEVLHEMLFTSWYLIGCALLGARLVQAQLLASGGKHLARRLVLLGMLAGVPCQIAAVALYYQDQSILSFLVNQLGALPQSLLYLVVLLRVAEIRRIAPLIYVIGAVGRTALSNYWLQSLLACVIFHGYGFGLFGISLASGLLVVLGIWLVQLIVSPLWLAVFQTGPLEWLWRSLAAWSGRALLKSA